MGQLKSRARNHFATKKYGFAYLDKVEFIQL